MSTLRSFSLILILVALAACSAIPASLNNPTQTTLATNRQKWESQHINHYRFQLLIGCFCAFRNEMPLTIEIRNDQVVSILNNQQEPVADDLLPMFETYNSIEKLFDVLDSVLNGGADQVTVEYNAEYGYPQSISIDYIQEAIDDEMGFTISDFEILG